MAIRLRGSWDQLCIVIYGGNVQFSVAGCQGVLGRSLFILEFSISVKASPSSPSRVSCYL